MYIRVAVAVADRFSFRYYFCCRPFVRKLPEFKFWVKSAKSLLVSFSMTFFPVFDVPVFWPILLMYFIMLFTMTMKQQLRHMIKHKYVPFSWGKQPPDQMRVLAEYIRVSIRGRGGQGWG